MQERGVSRLLSVDPKTIYRARRGTIGEEFIYPKHRARELAKASKVVVPAHEVADINDDKALVAAPIVAVPRWPTAPFSAACPPRLSRARSARAGACS